MFKGETRIPGDAAPPARSAECTSSPDRFRNGFAVIRRGQVADNSQPPWIGTADDLSTALVFNNRALAGHREKAFRHLLAWTMWTCASVPTAHPMVAQSNNVTIGPDFYGFAPPLPLVLIGDGLAREVPVSCFRADAWEEFGFVCRWT